MSYASGDNGCDELHIQMGGLDDLVLGKFPFAWIRRNWRVCLFPAQRTV